MMPLPPKYIVAIRYDDYESTIQTFVSRKEAIAVYQESCNGSREVYFGLLQIPKVKERV